MLKAIQQKLKRQRRNKQQSNASSSSSSFLSDNALNNILILERHYVIRENAFITLITISLYI
jgi:hypothetical protein